MPTKELIDVCPIKQIEDGKMINGTKDISVGFDVILPEIFTLSDSDAEQMEEGFQSILRSLPAGSILHKQDYIYSKVYQNDETIENFIHQSTVDSYLERPVLYHRSKIFITFCDQYLVDKPKSLSQVFNSISLFKNPFSNITEERMEMIEDRSKSVLHSLNSIKHCVATRMDNYALAASLYDYLNQSYDKPAAPDKSIKEKIVSPISFDKKTGLMMAGDKFVSVISLVNEGKELSSMKRAKITQSSVYNKPFHFSHDIQKHASLVYPLGIGFAADHILNTTIQIVENSKMKFNLMVEQRKLGTFATFGHSGAISKRNELKKYTETIDEHGYQSCLCHVDVIIRAESKETLIKYNDLALSHFDYMNNSKSVIENFESEALFFLSCPGNTNWNYRQLKTVTANAVMYLHKETHYLNADGGMLVADRFGTPVNLQFRGKNQRGAHKLILGPTGSGKSYFLNEYINQLLFVGTHVLIIDVGRSYERLCELNNGIFYDSGNSDLLSFNIFLCKQDKYGNYIYIDASEDEDKDRQVNFVLTCLLHLIKRSEEASTTEVTILQNSITMFYDYVNENKLFPDFTLYYNWMINDFKDTKKYIEDEYDKYFDLKAFKINLERFTEGKTDGKLLNAKRNMDLTNERLVVFEARAILKNSVIFPLFCLIVMDLFSKKITTLPRNVPKELINDEALDFLTDSKMGPFLGFQYRTARKMGAGISLATQNVEFIEKLAPIVVSSITVNTSTYIILSHKGFEALYPKMQSILSFTDNDIEILDSLQDGENYREEFIKVGNIAKAYRIGISEMANAVYSTTPDVVAKIDKLYRERKNYKAAVIQYIENLKKERT